ncbi:hypothetical protein QN404_04585 [Pseudomonas sp. RTS1]|uniref:hypothetical protein n=1 Tax=unclassified Pseudomonas TaxID=196821 RepID=UPI002B23B636|nr:MULTISPECIES: hypothetical protein [unclassified Pseudomonas]MEA9988168.1 hypothetical protein [Pseudomonas sp. RTS1]MEB0033848.1 hypothetical protein [Pseudomonas sp. RTS2]MEB0234066.1 hypothetical protein [Pseudomonas sp. 5S3]MEB0254807.1 hypothetical protein [Pseudomonas sp. 5S2]
MGRKRKPGLEWLDPENRTQRQWALDYLWAKGFQVFDKEDRADTPILFARHGEMLELGAKIERRNDGREIFQDMKAAWRQKDRRDSAKGKTVCAFTLSMSAKTNLREMAEDLEKSATALLESFITKAYKAHIRKRQKQQPKEVPRVARNYSFQGPNNIGERDNKEFQKSARPPEKTVETYSLFEPSQEMGDVNTAHEEAAVYSDALRSLPTTESPQVQERTHIPLLESIPGSQMPATTTIADELQTEQAAAVDTGPQPNDDAPPCAQGDAQLTAMKIGTLKKKRFTMPNDLLPKPWDADQSD